MAEDIGNVTGNGLGLPAHARNLRRDGGQFVRNRNVIDDDVKSLRGECQRNGSADAAPSAGDQCSSCHGPASILISASGVQSSLSMVPMLNSNRSASACLVIKSRSKTIEPVKRLVR